ncbi:scavenger receptor cysteine-rich type 1 protein M130-like [Thalassophryne amazonica]|uniref:scavenger receptor cysteine-rich type 1 protein M130-like n=1 Tax=Thalassophryne amazonica TaxID=390379 RepID=UPI001470ECF6|nr:scavenger receptor cysteine-rich type 1 protein M130-like [Thalassophryne amazonica]
MLTQASESQSYLCHESSHQRSSDFALGPALQSVLQRGLPNSVRLVHGSSLCSGRLQVKLNESWSSVCEDDFDQQDAQVVCRELGCGPPSVLQVALYGEMVLAKWTKEFHCGGNESGLLACGSSGSDRNSCLRGKAVGLTCSEPVRLVGGATQCAGIVEVNVQQDWRPVMHYYWTLKRADVVCRDLDCGSAVYTEMRRGSSDRPVWEITYECLDYGYSLRDCGASSYSSDSIQINCSEVLFLPIISLSSSVGGVSVVQQEEIWVFRGSVFTISCSIQPQYPGGSFQLTFTSSNATRNSTQPAVNHSALFLFPAANHTHRGNYSCVYNIHKFSHNFSSVSRLLSLTVSVPPDQTVVVVRLVTSVLLTLLLIIIIISCVCGKTWYHTTRGHKMISQNNIEMVNLSVSGAEGGSSEDEVAEEQV